MTDYPAPDIRNYIIGKGIVSFKKSGDMSFRDLGNVPSFEFQPDITTLDHFSARAGVKTKDRTVTIEKSGSITMSMEEFTAENMALALLGDVTTSPGGRSVIEIFGASQIEGELLFQGTNDIGPRWLYHFKSVTFIPDKSVQLIGDTWGTLEVTGSVAADDTGSFGTIENIGEEDSESEGGSEV